MRRFLLVLVLTALVTGFALMAIPWWVAMPVAFLILLIFPMRNARSFLAAGLGGAIAFFCLSYAADHANEHILSSKMATLFQLPSYILMLVITAFLGFITAGLGGWTASTLSGLIRKQKSKEELFVSQKSQS